MSGGEHIANENTRVRGHRQDPYSTVEEVIVSDVLIGTVSIDRHLALTVKMIVWGYAHSPIEPIMEFSSRRAQHIRSSHH